jgi:hypothetical protein
MRNCSKCRGSIHLHALAAVLSATLGLATSRAASDTVSLAGTWRFGLDARDTGLTEGWHKRALPDRIQLPGSLPAQGIGDPPSLNTRWTGGIQDPRWFEKPQYAAYASPGNFKFPFWLQPERYYAGPAWYQRVIEVPQDWQGKRVVLSLERPHWETRAWLDDRFIGFRNALGTPHDHDLGLLPAGRHTLTLRVDNRMVIDVGPDSHSVSDHTQGNWNGVVGAIQLRATAPVWIEDLQVYPNLARERVTLRGRIGNLTGQPGQGTVALRVTDTAAPGSLATTPRATVPVSWTAEGGSFEGEVRVPGAKPWDEFSPNLYTAEARMEEPQALADVKTTTFGFREISSQGTQFLINGRKTFIRGTLECCIFPKTGHPPTDLASWQRILGVAKAHGLNNLRFHSWCPPEAAFAAADELGFYFHVEASSWANSSSSLGDGKPVDGWIYEETDRILKYYGNHPSFILMPYGNEPGGAHHAAFLAKWVAHYKSRDPRRLWTSGAGWPQLAENQWHSTPDPRLQAWGGGLQSRINARPPETTADYRGYIRARRVPVVSHEIGQWCVYPNFEEMPKYTGYLKPKNFEIFRDLLGAHGLGGQARPFLLASGKLQTLCYKEDIEAALRTPGMGGFQLLDLHDFPGQGTALVGVLDPFWEEKGYVTPAEYSRFCNSTVPLARLAKRVFTSDEVLTAELEVAHFGPAPLPGVRPAYRLVDDPGKVHLSGHLGPRDVPVDNGVSLGSLNLDLRGLPAPARYKLVVGLETQKAAADSSRSARGPENDWDVWVYPPNLEAPVPAGIRVAEALTEEVLGALQQGEKVMLLIPPSQVRNDPRNKVVLGFSSIFWNTAWTHRQPPTTLGILCDPKHPALADFPTDFHSNWQWWYLLSRAGAMILDDLPSALQPTVQVIDDWFTARKLGLVIEGKLGKGALLVCSIDLQNRLEANPVTRQMRASLLRYLASDRFKPAVEFTPAQVRGLFARPAPIRGAGVKSIRASSAEEGFEAEKAVDGDPETMWHSRWTGDKPGFPHELRIEFNQPVRLRGVTLLPRQDNNRNGWIKDYAIHLSPDGTQWGEPVSQGTFPADASLKRVEFQNTQTARFLRLTALSGHSSGDYASLAEFDLIEAGN